MGHIIKERVTSFFKIQNYINKLKKWSEKSKWYSAGTKGTVLRKNNQLYDIVGIVGE